MVQPPYTVGTRGSALAMTQTRMAADLVAAAGGFELSLVTVKTEGDVLTGPLSQLGGTGVFAATLRTRLLQGEVDLAIHSLKDLPSAPCPGLVIGATPEREDPRDALCARDGFTLETLPRGARVGTGSPRRAAQLLSLRPDLTIVDIRGNVGTRLARVAGLELYGIGGAGLHGEKKLGAITGDCDAVILAASGLKRLGLEETVSQYLPVDLLLPAPGQGALALEVREDQLEPHPSELGRAVQAVDHLPTRMAVTAERALLARLEAGCAAPIGAYARYLDEQLVLEVCVASPDGSQVLRHRAERPLTGLEGARQLGREAAEELLAASASKLAGLSGAFERGL